LVELRVLEDSSTELREVRVVGHFHHGVDLTLISVAHGLLLKAFVLSVSSSSSARASSTHHLLRDSISEVFKSSIGISESSLKSFGA